jgi:hypothetical protein
MGTEGCLLRVKQLGHEANHSPQLRMSKAINPTPKILVTMCNTLQRATRYKVQHVTMCNTLQCAHRVRNFNASNTIKQRFQYSTAVAQHTIQYCSCTAHSTVLQLHSTQHKTAVTQFVNSKSPWPKSTQGMRL